MTDRSRLKKKQKKGNERRGNAKATQQARQNLKDTAKKIEEKITQSSAKTQGSSSYGGNAPARRGGSNSTQRTTSASTSINRRNERQTQYYGGISKGGKVKTTAERMKERTEARELQRDNIRRGNKNAAPHRMDSNVQNSLRDRLKQSQQPDIIKAAAQQQVGGYEKFIGNMTRGEATGKSGAMNRKLGGSSNTRRNDRLKPGQVVGKRPDNTETIKNIQKQRQKSADQISERGSKNIQESSKAIEDIKERNLAGAITYDENGNPVVDKKKKRAGDFKNWMLDLEVAGLQMGGDALLGIGTGGLGGMASMFTRAGGMAMDEAERAGASRDQAIKYGLAIGGVEALTEKIGAVASPLRKVYGKGVTDTLMEKIIGKMAAKSTAGEIGQRTFMSALTEGLEEMVAEGVEPTVANKIYADTVAATKSDEIYKDALSKGYSEEEARKLAKEAYNSIHQSTSVADIFRAGSIGAAMGGILGGAGNVIEAGRGAELKKIYGKDGIREMAKKAKDSDDDTVVARATAILDQIDNGGDVTAGQANAVFNAVQQQEAKDDETMRRYDAGIYAEMRRNGYESPLVEDEENGVVGLNRIASDKYQAVTSEAREAANEVVDSEEESGAIADAVAAVMTGIASPQQVSMFTTSNPQARAVFESVTGETLPKSNAQMREKLFAMSARNYVETAKEETDYLRDQINGVLNIDMTQDYGSSGQSAFADVMEDEAIDPRDNNKTVAASAFEDYYRAGALGIPMEQILQNGNPQHSTLSMEQKQAAYEAGIRDAQAQTSIPAGSAIAMGERLSMAKTGRPTGMLYVELSDETKPMFTGSQQRMYRELAKRLHINIHIVDDIVDDEGNVVGANGYYNKGEVYLSMNNDRGLELVFGHEVTHLIKASSPEAYAKLEELVRNRWEEQGGIDEAIKAKQEQYKGAVGQSLSESDALEEIIADATYEMFGDPEFVAKICAEEKTLGKTILYAIRTILANVRAALASSGGFTPSQNAQLLSQLDILSEFEDLWLQGLRDAARAEADFRSQTVAIEATEEDVENSDSINDFKRLSLREEQMDQELVEQLNAENKVKVYRAMQYIDGKLYPPMAAVVEGNLNGGTELNKWEQAEERPDLGVWKLKAGGKEVDKDTPGAKLYFNLKKGNGTSLDARYNPYIHTSLSPLNDQFSSAYARPNMVVVEGEVPESELTSGYKADLAKDSVGETEWKSGKVAGELKKVGKPRRVILSRYFRPTRVLENDEVAQEIAKLLEGTDIKIPANVVTPGLLSALEERGVEIDRENVPKKYKESGTRFSVRDQDYMDAVERGDMETAQQMVDEAAREAGYGTHLYHGTRSFGFTKIKTSELESKSDGGYYDWSPFFATDSIEVAQTYSSSKDVMRVGEAGEQFDEEKFAKEFRDAVSSAVSTVNSFAEQYNYMDYSNNVFAEAFEKLEDSESPATKVVEYLNDSVSDIISELAWSKAVDEAEANPDENKDVDVYADELQEGEEADKIWAAYDVVANLLFEYEDYKNGSMATGNYDLLANTNNLMEINAKGNKWNRIPASALTEVTGEEQFLIDYVNTRTAAHYARNNGYDGVKISNVYDDGGKGKGHRQVEPATVYIFFKPDRQVKSADPVTYDDNGNVIPLSERFNQENADIRYSVREDDFVRISPERMDSLIEEYAIPNNDSSNYTKAWIATINPRDFLTLTITDEALAKWTPGSVNAWGQEVRDLNEEDLRKSRMMPRLTIDSRESHSVIGHEGRHRMLALMRAGYTEVPVVINDISEANKTKKEPMDEMDLYSQDFGYGAVNSEDEDVGALVDVYDVIPINEKNRAEIERIYGGDEGVRFSVKEDSRVMYTPSGVEVVQNPTDSEYRSMREDILKEYPWLRGSGEVLLRKTYDEEGNTYYWDASSAIHAQVEPYINEHYKTRTSQQWKWYESPYKDEYPVDYSKTRFSVREPVEQVRDLIAVHNLREDDIRGAFELGGFPMPSIAITKGDIGHNRYGDITLMFNSDTIDPQKNRYNEVFGGDAYTPTFPEVRKKYNQKVLTRVREKLESILGLEKYQTSIVDGLSIPPLDNENVTDALRSREPSEAYEDNKAMQIAYLKEAKNFDVAIPTKEGRIKGFDRQMLEYLDDSVPEFNSDDIYDTVAHTMEFEPLVREARKKYYEKEGGKSLKFISKMLNKEMDYADVLSHLEALLRFRYRSSEMPQVLDVEKLADTLSKKVDKEGYKKWVADLFDGVVEKTGIRNNKDPFTPSGNRRSFEALHDEVTLDNVVKAMRRELVAGGNGLFGANPKGAAQKKYKNLDEIRADKERLQSLPEEDFNSISDNAVNSFTEVCRSIYEHNTDKFSEYYGSFGGTIEIGETIAEALNKTRAKEGIQKELRKWWTVTDEEMDNLMASIESIAEVPTEYFEAKPRRAVGFNEVKAAIVPNNVADDVRSELELLEIPITEYDPGIEGDRAEKVNIAADEQNIRFSIPEEPTPIPNEEDAIDYANGDPVLAEFAYDSSPYAQAGKAVREKSYDELKAKVERLQADKRLTHGRVLDTTSIRKDVENMLRTMASIAEQAGNPVLGLEGKMNKANARLVNDIIKNAKHIYKMMKSGREEEAVIAAMNVADDIVERIQVIDDAEYDTYKEMKKYLRETPITISEEDASNIPDFGTFKKNLFGKVRIVKEGGFPVDSVYEELMEMFPGVFDEELTHPADQLMAIVDARETFEPYDVMLTAEEREQLLKDTTMELLDIIADGEPWRSWADKKSEQYQNKVKMLQERHREALRSRTEKERARAERLVQAEKTKAKEKKEKAKDKKERLKAFGSIEKNHKWLSDRLLKPTDDKHIPEGYQIAIAELLMALDLQTERSKALEEKTGRVAQKTFKFRELLDAYEEIANPEGTGILEYDDTIVSMLKDSLAIKLDGKSVDALDTATMREVDTLLKAIVGNIKNVNKAFAAERDQTIDEMAAQVTADCNHIIDKRGTFSERKKNLKRYFLETSKVINIGMKKPREFFTHLGKGMTDAYMEIRHGEDKHFRNMQVLRGKFEEIFKQYNNKKKPGSAIEKWRDTSTLQTFELENGESVKLNIAQVMSLYCLSKREQALGHIYGSGIVPSKVEGISGKIIHKKNEVEGSKVMVTYGDVMKIIDSLTEEQRTMADQLQALLNNEVAAWGNETSMLLYNYEKFTEKNYFPIKSDDAYLDSSFEGRTAEERIRNFGFTKGTITNANNPIVIADIFEVVTDHCNKMSLYNAFAAPLADFTRLYNSKFRNEDGTLNSSVKDMITKAYGKDTHEYIQNFMADVNNNTQVRPDETRAVVNKFLANYKRATIGMNMRVAVQQPTAIVRAFDVIDPKYFVADKQMVAPWRIKRDIKEMCDHCPIALWKSWGHNDVDMARDLDDIMMNKAWSRFDIITMGTYGALDIWTWSKIWNAVKREIKAKNPGVEVGSDEYWDLCNERASEVFDRTQVVDSVLHRSQTMRSKDTMTKMISSFMAEPTTTFNMLQSDIAEARDLIMEGEKGKAAKKLTRCMTVFGLNAAAVSAAAAVIDLLRGKEPDDDDKDKEGFELWYANFLNNFIDNANPIKMIPYPSTAWDVLTGTFGSSNMAFEGWESLGKGMQEFAKFLKGDSKKTQPEIMWMVGDGIGNVLGIPVKSVDKDYHALMNRLGISFATDGSEEKVRVTGDDGSIFEFYPGENMSLTEKFFKMIGIENNSKTDNFLNKFGINLSEEEKQEQEYQNRKDEILKKCEGLEGEEREKKLWSIITGKKDEENLGITSYIESADFDKVEEMKKLYVACGGDKATFDEKVIKKAKTAYKKTIGVNDAMDRQFDTYDFLIRNGVSEAEISEIVKSSDTAREFKKAYALGDDTSAALTLSYLTDAGLSYEDYEYLCSVASRSVKASDYATGEFDWPTNGTVTSNFGHRASPGGIGSTNHQGIDIGAASGTPVSSADGGKVISAGWNGGYGNCVIIDHGNGYKTLYGHLSGYEVKQGQIVKKNQQIGKVGSTGNSTGPHLHFGVMENDHYVNPANYLQR